jgi:hypothetical protein
MDDVAYLQRELLRALDDKRQARAPATRDE